MKTKTKKLKEILLKLPFTIFEIGMQRFIIAKLPDEVDVVEIKIPVIALPLKTFSDLYFDLGEGLLPVNE